MQNRAGRFTYKKGRASADTHILQTRIIVLAQTCPTYNVTRYLECNFGQRCLRVRQWLPGVRCLEFSLQSLSSNLLSPYLLPIFSPRNRLPLSGKLGLRFVLATSLRLSIHSTVSDEIFGRNFQTKIFKKQTWRQGGLYAMLYVV